MSLDHNLEIDPIIAIHVKSIVGNNNDPLVLVSYEKTEATLTIAEARKLAFSLIRAAAIAETEAGIVDVLKPQKKGFGEPSKKDMEMFASALNLVRHARPGNIPENINPIYGYHSQKALIEYSILGLKMQLDPDEVLHHAMCLLEVSEAAERDAFFYKFGDRMKMERYEVEEILAQLADFRKRTYLEGLL